MVRVLLAAAAALALVGAKKPPHVDYRLAVDPQPSGPALLEVEMRLRGDADGETRLTLPPRLASDVAVRGAQVQAPDATHRVLRHRPGAKLTVRYRAPAAGGADVAVLGQDVFAAPEGRSGEAATFRLHKLPSGWRSATDLEPGERHAMTVGDVVASVILAGPDVQVAERPIQGGTVRAAVLGNDPAKAQKLADAAAPAVSALRAFWGDESGPFLVVAGPFLGAPMNLGDAVAFAEGPTSEADIRDVVAQAHSRAWLPGRTGRTPPEPEWFTAGFADVYADRALMRAGLLDAGKAVARLDEADRGKDAARRGQILALKWDDEIRRKTAGKADLDDVLLRMRDHYRRFAPGQGPDVVTGLVSAAWVTAGLDLRPDIARYAEDAAEIPLPETLFDGCMDALVTVSPGFDSGFDHEASISAKRVTGVRRRGPAWNSGLRDGMTLVAWKLAPGDMTHEIELTVRDSRKRVRKIRYWPYGDADVESRKLRIAVGLTGDKLAACANKIAGG
jgi:predicted metalloprotease with PDZ domain